VGSEEPLRILALLEATSISGTAKGVLEMAYEAQADADGEPKIEISVANFARGNGAAQTDNVLIRALRAAGIPYSFINEKGRFDRSVIPQLKDLVKETGADAVWSNSVKSHFLVRQAGLQESCRWVAFHHGYTATDLKMRFYNQLDRISLRRADRVITVCQPFARQMEARGVSTDRIRVQHMPIRPFFNSVADGMSLRAELKLPPGASVILSVGRLSREKGHANLITAFARLRAESQDRGLYLVLVGDGPERARLQQQAQSLSVGEQVLFTGQRDDAKRFYGIASVFALPSYTEGTPNVLLESMAAGLPLVATSVGGIPELAADGKNALLVPAANATALAAALRRLLDSPVLRKELANEAQAVVLVHSPRSYFESMRQIFAEAIAE
jgi:glycosyltransferase involved in cell wall biosynthesis